MSIIAYIASLLDSVKYCISFVDYFFEKYDIEGLLKECGARKSRGIPYVKILKFLVCMIFKGETSINRALKNIPDAGMSLDTVRGFLQDENIDWIKFTTKLSIRVLFSLTPEGLTDPLKIFLIVDDTDWPRNRSRYVEGLTYQRNHVNNTNYKGFRFQTAAMIRGNLFLPANFVIVSTQNKEKVLAPVLEATPGTPSEKRKELLFSSLLEALYYQVEVILENGLKPEIILMDTWYSFPVVLYKLKEMGLDSVAALKNATTRYLYNGEMLRSAEIFHKVCPERTKPDKNGIFAVVEATAFYEGKGFPIKLVYAENFNESREYFCIVTTDLSINAPLIVAYYKYRFEIEVFFKTVKNPKISLTKGTKTISIDGMYGYAAVVFTQVILLITQRVVDGAESISLIDQFYRTKEEIEAAETVNGILSSYRYLVDAIVKRFHVSREESVKFLESCLMKDKTFEAAVNKLSKCNFENVNLQDFEKKQD